jgi:hypothetical protein
MSLHFEAYNGVCLCSDFPFPAPAGSEAPVTFNPKVAGSIPARPILTRVTIGKPHGYEGHSCQECRFRSSGAPPGAPLAPFL